MRRSLLLLALLSGCRGATASPSLPVVTIHTSAGDIVVEVDSVRAPVSAANFLRYVDAGRYSNGRFHRTVTMDNQAGNPVKIEVIQGGRDTSTTEFDPVPLERTSGTGLHHLDGTVSMARGGPDTATSDFFICIGNQPGSRLRGKRNPDGQGFAAFGRVTAGMDVVRRIHESPAQGQSLTPAIAILSIVRGG